MPTNNIKSKSGFTIIEVVLVLAVAGLIFLMVFIALPALQRSQRDTQRRQDYANLSSQITQYMTSNNNRLPAAGTNLPSETYINKTGKDPDGIPYGIIVQNAGDDAWTAARPIRKEEVTYSCEKDDGTTVTAADANACASADGEWTSHDKTSEVYVVTHANCDGDVEGYAAPAKDSRTRAFAIYGYLETGTYCQSSI